MLDMEKLYYEKELADIKNHCIKNGLSVRYKNQDFYLYEHKLYDKNMELIIDHAENGFLDLFEYYEYFEQIERN